MAILYFSAMRALKKERAKVAQLRREKNDLMDEVHHLKVRYGELPVISFDVYAEEDINEEEHP
jgi:hypothetical protein